MKNILTNSLIATIVSIILFFILDKIDPKLNFNPIWGIVTSSIIYFFFIIRAGLQERKKAGGLLGLGEAFIISFGVYAIVSLLNIFFLLAMIKMYPELMDIAKETSIEMIEKAMAMMGTSENEIALQIEEHNVSQIDMFDLKTMIINWLGALIFPGALYVLIPAFIVRKKA